MSLSKVFQGNTETVFIQLLRYGLVACSAAFIDTGLLYVFTHYLHWFYLVSATISFLISLIVNYYLSSKWVFSRSSYQRHIEIIAFILIGIVGLGLNLVIIWFFTSAVGLFYLESKLLALIGVFFWSFWSRRILFHNPAAFNRLLPAKLRANPAGK